MNATSCHGSGTAGGVVVVATYKTRCPLGASATNVLRPGANVLNARA